MQYNFNDTIKLYQKAKNLDIKTVWWILEHQQSFGLLISNIVANYWLHQWWITKEIIKSSGDKIKTIFDELNPKLNNINFSYNSEQKDIYINWKSIKEFMISLWIKIDIFFDATCEINGWAWKDFIITNPLYINNKNQLYIFILFHELWHIYNQDHLKNTDIDPITDKQLEIEKQIKILRPKKWRDSRYRDFVSVSKAWEYEEKLQNISQVEIWAYETWTKLMRKFFDDNDIYISDVQYLIDQWQVIQNLWLTMYSYTDPIISKEKWLFHIDNPKFQKFIQE